MTLRLKLFLGLAIAAFAACHVAATIAMQTDAREPAPITMLHAD
jgi:hypothetical protein